jgi:Helix-turn-helix domain
MTHPAEVVAQSLELASQGRSAAEVARLLGIPRATVRDWMRGCVPRRSGTAYDLQSLPPAYVYLLGMYLGDGCLSAHPRGVYKLRISMFPQHGPGKKHERPIELAEWQWGLVRERPDLLLRGLLHSDGCRFINTGRGGWAHPRYSFMNRSADIRAIFCVACDLLGLRWTASANRTIYVSCKDDVALLDLFVGPKS